MSKVKTKPAGRATILWFWIALAMAVLLALASVYFYITAVPPREFVAPGDDSTKVDQAYGTWYAIIAAAAIAGIVAIVSLARSLRGR